MPTKNRVVSRAVKIVYDVAETPTLLKEGQVGEQRSGDGKGSGRNTDCGKNANKRRGDEQCGRDGKGNIRNSRSVKKMPTKNWVISR
jgi:hypothetical protein